MNNEINVNSISTDSIIRICAECGVQDVDENMVQIMDEIFCETCAEWEIKNKLAIYSE